MSTVHTPSAVVRVVTSAPAASTSFSVELTSGTTFEPAWSLLTTDTLTLSPKPPDLVSGVAVGITGVMSAVTVGFTEFPLLSVTVYGTGGEVPG